MRRPERFKVPGTPEALPLRCPCTGLPIHTRRDWTYTNPQKTYRTTIARIGDHLFWVIPRGYIDEDDMRQAIQMADAIKAESLPDDGPFVFIENFAYTRGAAPGARRLYLQFTNAMKGLLGSFPYGMTPFFRLSFNFSRRLRLHQYRVHMVTTYEEAVTSALELLAQSGLSPPSTPLVPVKSVHGKNFPKSISEGGLPSVKGKDPGDVLSAEVDGLLAYLGQLDLASPGIPDIPDTARRSALGPVYEALTMLKMDMDQFLVEHRDLVTVLREGRKEQLRKAAAVETRNRELQILLHQSSEDQKKRGQIAVHNIQTLLKPLLHLIREEARTSEQQEWVQSLGDRVDGLSDDLIPGFDLHRYKLTPQEIRVARLIRDGERSKAIAGQLGVSVRTIDFYRGRLRAKLGLQGRKGNLRTALLAILDE